MNFKKHLEKSWNLLFNHIVSLIILTVVMFGVSIISFGILAPVTTAGYMQSILMMVRENREPTVQDLFSQMKLFFPLLGFGIITVFLTMIGFLLFLIPGVIMLFAVTFICTYMLPLMTDQGLNLFDAIKKSYTITVKDNPAEHFILVVLYLCILAIGSSIFIGALVTTPFAVIFLLSVYNEKNWTNNPIEKQR